MRILLTGVVGVAFLGSVANLAVLSWAESAPDPAPRPAATSNAVDGAAQRPQVAELVALVRNAHTSPPRPPATTPTPSDARIVEVEAAWRAWMTEQQIPQGNMALALPDGRVIRASVGDAQIARVPVASLSKAITGLCLDGLLTEHGLSWDTTLGDIADEMSSAGVTPRPWNAHITLADLVTHTAGLAPDLTQGDLVARTHGALGLHRRIAFEALARDAITGTPGTMFYSNTNYAVLGVVIEALSGRSYADTCMERVLHPAGVDTAVIQGRMGSMSSYAGWEMSAEAYARLARHWFTAGQPHVSAPETRPNVDGYAMGYRIAGSGPGARATHNGRLCHDPSTRDGIGATFVATGRGLAFVATWSQCIDRDNYDDLIERIAPLLR